MYKYNLIKYHYSNRNNKKEVKMTIDVVGYEIISKYLNKA